MYEFVTKNTKIETCQCLMYQYILCVPQKSRTSFEDEVKQMVKENLLDPICQHVETDLRLSIHSHLQLDDRNPFRVGLSDLAPFIQMKPIKFNDSSIDIKA